MEKILVTGGGGFIGSHLVENLLSKGKKVSTLVRYNSKSSIGWLEVLEGNQDNLEIIKGDLRDIDSFARALIESDIVINLAALIPIPYSYVAPRSFIDVNTNGVFDLLNFLRKTDKRFVQISTSEVYGTAKYSPMDELHPINPQSPYAASKSAADSFVSAFCKSYEMNAVIARPFNTFGPRQSTRAVIPTIITQALNSNFVEIGETNSTRSFNYVKDTVEGILKVTFNGIPGETYNIGQEEDFSIIQTIDLIGKILNKNLEVNSDNRRIRPSKSEVSKLTCDSQKIQKLTKWRQEFVGLDGFTQGLKETIEWFRFNKVKENYTL